MFVQDASLRGLIKMARVVVTLKIMPVDPSADLSEIEKHALDEVFKFAGKTEFKVEQVPVAFGLTSVNVTFVMDEAKGSTEELEKKIAKIKNVNSVDVIDVRRTIG